MKELTIEQKAKAYDEAVKEAAIAYKDEDRHLKATLERIFPELREPEDEKIRKELTEYLKSASGGFLETAITCKTFGKWLAWIEKQGEHLENYDETEKEKAAFVGDGFIECHADFLDFKKGETYWLEYIDDDKYNVRSDNLLGKTYHITPCQLYTVFKKLTWLEKQGEQKPADKVEPTDYNSIDPHFGKPIDKVEPKFHEGDWIVFNGLILFIKEVVQGYYRTISVDGIPNSYDWDIDNVARLWTIQDAENGDVLVSQYGKPFIYNGNHDSSTVGSYCGITVESRFDVATEKCRWTENVNIQPATQEQRDTLMKAMADAGYGYTVDFEKKEFKIIELKPHLE